MSVETVFKWHRMGSIDWLLWTR